MVASTRLKKKNCEVNSRKNKKQLQAKNKFLNEKVILKKFQKSGINKTNQPRKTTLN